MSLQDLNKSRRKFRPERGLILIAAMAGVLILAIVLFSSLDWGATGATVAAESNDTQCGEFYLDCCEGTCTEGECYKSKCLPSSVKKKLESFAAKGANQTDS